MSAAPPHVDEARRLAALRRLGILDSAPEERFDRITRLASLVIGVPIALVSLIDEDRQWFKSRVGLALGETCRDVAFCSHAIVAEDNECPDGLFIVDDAAADPRFSQNPLVIGSPKIRFYAGRVLRDPAGLPLGTLCAVDVRPRVLTASQREALTDLAALAEQELQRNSERELFRQLDDSEQRRSLILETLTEGLVFQASDGRILDWNPAAERVLGLSGDELSGRTSTDPRWAAIREDGSAWPGESHPAMEALRTGQSVLHQVMGVDRPDGSRAWLRVNAQPVLGSDGAAISVVTAFNDFTAEHQMMLDQRRFSCLFERSNDIISIVDANLNVLYRSPSSERVLGYADKWTHPEGVFALVHPDDREAATERLLGVLAGKQHETPFLVRIRASSGEWRYFESIAVSLLHEPAVAGIVITSRDVTDRQQLIEQLAFRAAHDELTELPNRRTLASHIEHALEVAGSDDRQIALCFVDLDGFKQVNDNYGHAAGDALLVDVAGAIRSALRPSDLGARVGGDEFVVVFDPVTDAAEAWAMTSRLHHEIVASQRQSQSQSQNQSVATFGASVGLAISGPGESASTLLQRADAALYRAKQQRSCVEFADSAP